MKRGTTERPRRGGAAHGHVRIARGLDPAAADGERHGQHGRVGVGERREGGGPDQVARHVLDHREAGRGLQPRCVVDRQDVERDLGGGRPNDVAVDLTDVDSQLSLASRVADGVIGDPSGREVGVQSGERPAERPLRGGAADGHAPAGCADK